MGELRTQIEAATVPVGAVQLWWLGGAGFAFKTATGRVLFLDPYLSDSVERLHGFKRMVPPPLLPDDVRCDAVLCTHDHTDHLDPDTVPAIARNNPGCVFAGPASCVAAFRGLGIAPTRLVELPLRGVAEVIGVNVHTVPSDHGDYAADAVTPLLDCGGVRVLHSGDTSLCPLRFKPLYDLHPDLLLPCINGNFGNMNAIDAAQMARLRRAGCVELTFGIDTGSQRLSNLMRKGYKLEKAIETVERAYDAGIKDCRQCG